MRFKPRSLNAFKELLVFTLFFLFLSTVPLSTTKVYASTSGLYHYEFLVDKNGFTIVNITYTIQEASGSSWVFVPRFSEWTNNTIKGTITDWSIRDSANVTENSFYFYEVFFYSYVSDSMEFQLNILYNISTAAMIIEPDGIFFSPQIGFEPGNRFEAVVIFPQQFKVNRNKALAYGKTYSYTPSSFSSGRVFFSGISETENLLRIEIGFTTPEQKPDLVELTNGVFTFKTVSRYTEYATSILDLYNRTYSDLVDLFNVTLEKANVKFFIPDFESLLLIGGYVPFTSNRMGDININFVFTRYVEGYIEVIALHELVHHFLWKAGISPKSLLWFHEGMAQYVSMEIGKQIGYEGMGEISRQMEESVAYLKELAGENFGFIQDWSMNRQPENIGYYYTAAYHVVRSLAEKDGELRYYARFFKIIKGRPISSNAELVYYLSIASNKSIAELLNNWGFNIPDLYLYSPLLEEAIKVLDGINPVYQPYKYLARLIYEQALSKAKKDTVGEMRIYLSAAIIIAKLAPLLTIITISGVLFAAILLLLKKEGVFWNY
ncbi:hypothetical protein KEJ33_05360 [Candidatus Bathyarchaeota archaeon]|nr:hypothetical protein [Candidatus Bathyarchaeota archaeon]